VLLRPASAARQAPSAAANRPARPADCRGGADFRPILNDWLLGYG